MSIHNEEYFRVLQITSARTKYFILIGALGLGIDSRNGVGTKSRIESAIAHKIKNFKSRNRLFIFCTRSLISSEELSIIASFSILLHSTAPPPQFQEGSGEWSILLYPGVLKTINGMGFGVVTILNSHFQGIVSMNLK